MCVERCWLLPVFATIPMTHLPSYESCSLAVLRKTRSERRVKRRRAADHADGNFGAWKTCSYGLPGGPSGPYSQFNRLEDCSPSIIDSTKDDSVINHPLGIVGFHGTTTCNRDFTITRQKRGYIVCGR